MIKKKKILIFVSIVAGVIALALGVFLYNNNQKQININAAGESWLSGWSKRKATTITNNDSRTGTVYGNPVLGSTGKFGTAITMDGSGDYISVADFDELNFGTDNFTIDTWLYPQNVTSEQLIMGQRAGPGGETISFYIEIYNGYVSFVVYSGTSYYGSYRTATISINTWTHIALVRNGTTITMYKNGVASGSQTIGTASVNNPSSPLIIGMDDYWDGHNYTGLIDEVRISKGIARWTSSFTPSTSAYTSDQYTKLLLHLNETSGTTITDFSKEITNYQALLTISYDSDMQADFDDLRFTSSDGITLLDYWLESKTDSSTANVWVEIPYFTLGSNTIYIYYGNSGATSVSSGANTFRYFDDFSSSTNWNFLSGASISGNQLTINVYNPGFSWPMATYKTAITVPYVLMYEGYMIDGSQSATRFSDAVGMTSYSSTDPQTIGVGYLDYSRLYGDYNTGVYSSLALSTGTWYKVDHTVTSSSSKIKVNGVTSQTSISHATGRYVGFGMAHQNSKYRNFAIREYTAVEPTVVIGSEELIAPVISQVYPIYGPTNDTTPNYTFNSTATGTITYGGSCSSSTTEAIAGNNTITLSTLTPGIYSNCTIQVSGSNVLTIPKFIIGEDCGSNSEVECSRGLDDGYYINRYTYISGAGAITWTVPVGVSSVEYLVVAGGGGGGGSNAGGAGGGGAGGLLTGASLSVSGTVSITVGAGGTAGASAGGHGGDGSNSTVLSGETTITARGGGGGGGNPSMNGNTGGSGGGGYYTGTKGESYNNDEQGHDGNIGDTTYWATGGGGGGAGTAGGLGTASNGGNGGNGETSSLSGASLAYAAGGGGSVQTSSLVAGIGGSSGIGGNGNNSGAGTAGLINTGSGGGAAGGGTYSGGAGGSGVVIIKYLASQNHNYYCSYYYDDDDVLQVGKDGFLDFKFTYGDPNSSATLSGYRIAIDTSDLALGNIDSQADVIVPDTSTWVSGGNAVPGTQITNSQISVKMIPNASLEQIGYGTGTVKQSYYWWVKVKNSNGLESDWIPGSQFYTPKRHYPIVRPIATTENITINANMQFCAGTDLTNQNDPEERDACYSACWTGTAGSAVVGESEANWKCSICYDSTNSPVSCTDPTLLAEGKTLFTWHGPTGYVLNTDYTYESSTASTSANPVIKFTKTGNSLKMGLNITGSDCGGETVEMVIGAPMPIWKEVSPF